MLFLFIFYFCLFQTKLKLCDVQAQMDGKVGRLKRQHMSQCCTSKKNSASYPDVKIRQSRPKLELIDY